MRTSLPLGLATALLGAATASSLLASSPAQAGGLGIIASGGLHTEKAYWYELDDTQHIDTQARPNGAVGIEALLGDKDDRVQGLFRLYVLTDAPTTTPDIGSFTQSEVQYPPADKQPWSNKGVMLAGVQWGLLGDPGKMDFVLDTLIGSGFATTDSLEFITVDVGPGFTYKLSDGLQFTANASVNARYRKGFSYGGGLVAGIRYMFD